MTIYVVAFSLSALIAEYGRKTRAFLAGQRWPVILLSMFPVWFLAAFRYFVGSDYPSYKFAFFNLTSGEDNQFEWLYKMLNRFIGKMGGDYEWLVAICALIFLIPVFFYIFDYSPTPGFSIFLLLGSMYYFAFLNQSRQLMASAILMYSLKYVEERKPYHFFAFLVLASGFHSSSWMFAIMYFYRYFRLSPVKAIIITVLFFVFQKPIIALMRLVFEESKFEGYLSGEGASLSRYKMAIQLSILLFASVYFEKNDRFSHLYFGTFIAACFSMLGGTIAFSHRMIYTFALSTIVFIPIIVFNMKTKSRTIAIIVILACYLAATYYYSVVIGMHDVVPYQFVFGKT